MPDHPLDLMPLVIPLDLAFEKHPAALDPGMHLAFGNLRVPAQGVGDRPGDFGVIPWFLGQPDLQFIGNGLDAIHARGRADCRQLLAVGRHTPGQGDRPILDCYADSLGIRHLRIPLQLANHVYLDVTIGLHRPPGRDAR